DAITIIDLEVFAVNPAQLPQPCREQHSPRAKVSIGFRLDLENPDPSHPLALLPPRRERPSGRCAAEERDELATFHSITSSVSASTVAGTSRPSALAALRFSTNSNLVGCCTGRSPGFSPRRMRAT